MQELCPAVLLSSQDILRHTWVVRNRDQSLSLGIQVQGELSGHQAWPISVQSGADSSEQGGKRQWKGRVHGVLKDGAREVTLSWEGTKAGKGRSRKSGLTWSNKFGKTGQKARGEEHRGEERGGASRARGSWQLGSRHPTPLPGGEEESWVISDQSLMGPISWGARPGRPLLWGPTCWRYHHPF